MTVSQRNLRDMDDTSMDPGTRDYLRFVQSKPEDGQPSLGQFVRDVPTPSAAVAAEAAEYTLVRFVVEHHRFDMQDDRVFLASALVVDANHPLCTQCGQHLCITVDSSVDTAAHADSAAMDEWS